MVVRKWIFDKDGEMSVMIFTIKPLWASEPSAGKLEKTKIIRVRRRGGRRGRRFETLILFM